MARRLVEMIDENRREMLGPGEYAKPMIERLNQRLADYAELPDGEEGPGYSALRLFADNVLAGIPEENRKWMTEQLIEVEAPRTLEHLYKGLRDQVVAADGGSGEESARGEG